MSDLVIRAAEPAEVPLLLTFIRELAEYERRLDEVCATEEKLKQALFGPTPAAEAVVAVVGRAPAGFALFYHSFSTFLGRRGVHLEDLYVRPSYRRRGVGQALLLHVARVALERGCERFEWTVLEWNESALEFYNSLGAKVLEDWRVCRVTGEALNRLARLP